MTKKDEIFKFPGFPEDLNGLFWMYPRIMDSFWYQLSPTEQKIMDFILRRTLGWQKTGDEISLSQFKEGITTKDGRWDERGTGIKTDEAIINATKRLEELGFIFIVRQKGKTNIYKLHLLPQTETPTPPNKEVATSPKQDTIKAVTKEFKTTGVPPKNPKPYYNGMRMYKDEFRKWWCIPKEGGKFFEFGGHEWEIEWRR